MTLFIPANAASTSVVDKSGQEVSDSYLPICEEMAAAISAGTLYESESNNTSSTADRTYNDYDNYGIISTSGDVDWWVVKFSGNGYANFWLGNIPSNCDYDMKLYSSNGTTLLKSSTKA